MAAEAVVSNLLCPFHSSATPRFHTGCINDAYMTAYHVYSYFTRSSALFWGLQLGGRL